MGEVPQGRSEDRSVQGVGFNYANGEFSQLSEWARADGATGVLILGPRVGPLTVATGVLAVRLMMARLIIFGTI